MWAAGEVVQEEVHISAAKLQSGSYAVWMGMYAPVTQMRAAVEASGVVVDIRATNGIPTDSVIVRSTSGMPVTSTAGSGCRV